MSAASYESPAEFDTGPAEFDTGIRPDQVDPQHPRPIITPWGEYSLFRIAGEILVAQSFCPHLSGPLFQGTLHRDTVTCPWHFWRFSLRTGERLGWAWGGTGKERLSLCSARVGPAGTLVLARPARPPRVP